VDPLEHAALRDFYREEFERQIEHLLTCGILGEESRAAADPVCRRFLDRLDRVCWRADFPLVAEALLRNFDALTQLSSIDSTKAH
jgi:hypothetical protein